jgi:NAD-dependent deacetylase sirtuin 4
MHPSMLHDHLITDLRALHDLLVGRRVVALTGAGCSTDSGIPDYRGPQTRDKARNPIQYRQFRDSAQARQRYWARSAIGWQRIAAARPNATHLALARLEDAGILAGVITQNVDRLHHVAGSRRVVELHGALADVRCLSCQQIEPRSSVQRRLQIANPGRLDALAELAPDGDAEVGDTDDFTVVGCLRCGGVLKPDVVFFGENVPPGVVADAWALFAEAEVLLVLGSSLAVFSGYRFVHRAAQQGIPVGIVNLGTSRGDGDAAVRVSAPLGLVLPILAESLMSPRTAPPAR